ncbi:Hypothetical protein PMT_2285 [Prochlorococcus marinus str. MIT 9313]|uniref:Uncharacterized protein n=1 Tax=Prochlorococcus marinus (strain MIT 9313) TaxID=74547 RepID=B9ERC4_PROMM|nr:Hypothetical protein PMT_2285 [Prochlorococcus marinus str. MIT 9313]
MAEPMHHQRVNPWIAKQDLNEASGRWITLTDDRKVCAEIIQHRFKLLTPRLCFWSADPVNSLLNGFMRFPAQSSCRQYSLGSGLKSIKVVE